MFPKGAEVFSYRNEDMKFVKVGWWVERKEKNYSVSQELLIKAEQITEIVKPTLKEFM